MKEYLDRYLDVELRMFWNIWVQFSLLGQWCGKTTTAKQHAASIIQLQDPTYSKSYLKLDDVDPLSLLKGKNYINVLKQLFVIDEIKAWGPKIRSKTAMRNSSKKNFIDSSIAVASLDLTPEKLLYDLDTGGHIFESLCIRDLNVYSSQRGGKILQYHDQDDLEVDCVLTLSNEDYALIEFKLGSKEEEDAAKNLLKLKEIINKKRESGEIKIPEPKFLAIINGGKIALTRDDGVKVIPIGCLK